MFFEELDASTRQFMLAEFEEEQLLPNRYISKALTDAGLIAFPSHFRNAILNGDDQSLYEAILNTDFWQPYEEYTRNGETKLRKRNIPQSAKRLATTEFSTLYVLGFAKRLLSEGEKMCQVYRGEEPKWEPGECAEHEGKVVEVAMIVANHRKRYWPHPGDQSLFSIPFTAGCHHLIKRIKS